MYIDNKEKRTWLTLITNENYLYGVVGLYFSLQEVGTKYPFHCIVTSNLKPELIKFLQDIGIQTILEEPGYVSPSAYEQQIANGNFPYQSVVSFHTKMKMYFYTQFDKIVYLDADMLVLQNVDELFDYPHLSYCLDCPSYYKDYFHINGGLLVFEPKKMPADLKDFIDNNQDWRYGDESVLMNFFNMESHREQWLDPYYDVWWSKIDEWYKTTWWFNPQNIKIIHYVIGTKPWNKDREWLKNLPQNEPDWYWWYYYLKKDIDFLNIVIDYLEEKGLTYPSLVNFR